MSALDSGRPQAAMTVAIAKVYEARANVSVASLCASACVLRRWRVKKRL